MKERKFFRKKEMPNSPSLMTALLFLSVFQTEKKGKEAVFCFVADR
jgi:hypothetical protein